MSNMTDLWLSGVFFSISKYSKTRLRPGLRRQPRWGAYDDPPDSLVGWGGGHYKSTRSSEQICKKNI